MATASERLAAEIIRRVEVADSLAAATDGPVPATHEVMRRHELIRFFRCAYQLALLVNPKEHTDAD